MGVVGWVVMVVAAGAGQLEGGADTATITAASRPVEVPGYLGLALQDLGGAFEVASVAADSPAARAHFAPGLRVLALDGVRLTTWAEVDAVLGSKRAGDTVAVTIALGAQEKTLPVVLEVRPPLVPRPGTAIAVRAGAPGLTFVGSPPPRVVEGVDDAWAVMWSLAYAEISDSFGPTRACGGGFGLRYFDAYGLLPDRDGGLAHAVIAEARVAGMGGGQTQSAIPTTYVVPSETGRGLLRATVSVGYAALYFLEDEAGGAQQGLGLKLGVEGGAVLEFQRSLVGPLVAELVPVIGPAIAIELPRSDPSRGEVSFTAIELSITPLDRLATTISVSGSF